MAESYSKKEIRYYNQLDLEAFSKMLKDPSFCYKFYWLEAIVHLIARGITKTTFNEIINEMIANAWYSVREYHIHLSGLQSGIHFLKHLPGINIKCIN